MIMLRSSIFSNFVPSYCLYDFLFGAWCSHVSGGSLFMTGRVSAAVSA